MIRIRELVWDKWNEEHIWKHNVSPGEVEEFCYGNFFSLRRRGRLILMGQVYSSGRYLFVVLEHVSGGSYYPVTARDMNSEERREYRRRTGK
jgi:uncharacterized DUF497 family protein